MADTVGNETFFPALPWLARQGLLFFPAVFLMPCRKSLNEAIGRKAKKIVLGHSQEKNNNDPVQRLASIRGLSTAIQRAKKKAFYSYNCFLSIQYGFTTVDPLPRLFFV
jgi:hypothetical protein